MTQNFQVRTGRLTWVAPESTWQFGASQLGSSQGQTGGNAPCCSSGSSEHVCKSFTILAAGGQCLLRILGEEGGSYLRPQNCVLSFFL